MTGSEFIKKCKTGLTGGYFLYGDEDYMKLHAVISAEKSALDPDFAEFNKVNISAKDDIAWCDALFEAITTPPTFSPQKLIILRDFTKQCYQAQKGDDDTDKENDGAEKASKKKGSGEFERFTEIISDLKNEPDKVLLVVIPQGELDHGKLPKSPSSIYKKLSSYLEPVYFERQTPARLHAWVIKKFSAEGLLCGALEAKFLTEYCSEDMFALGGEIEKLICYLKAEGRNKLTDDDIRLVSSHMKIDGEFDFSNHLLNGDTLSALRMFCGMKKKKERPEIILSSVITAVTNMYNIRILSESGISNSEISAALSIHEYRVGLYLSSSKLRSKKRLAYLLEECANADWKVKTSGLDKYTVIERLIIEVTRV